MRKNIKFLMVFIIISMISIDNIKSMELTENIFSGYSTKDICSGANLYGDVIMPTAYKVKDEVIYSYCEFENQEDAINIAYSKFNDVFDYIENSYSIEKINIKNWSKYYELLLEDDNQSFNISTQLLLGFFDILENKEKNDDIRESVRLLNSLKETESSSQYLRRLYENLPYYNADFLIKNDMIFDNYSKNNTFSISKGLKYAEKYAWSANVSKYGRPDGGDCTNFASQILENGGYSQVWGINTHFGWWYKNNNSNFTYSWAWANANSFAKYWGIQYSTNDFYAFSKKVKKGNFIILDSNNDGDYNHAGFVTQTTKNYKKYQINNSSICTIVEFNDFKVAQHSKDYNELVSGDDNNWERGVLTNTKYAILKID